MLVVNVIAITGAVLGIGGLAGAIERGTSPVAAIVCLTVGCVCMRISYSKQTKKGVIKKYGRGKCA